MNNIIYPEFLGKDNVEFVISNTSGEVTKVLYRSFGKKEVFRKKIYDFFVEHNILGKEENEKLKHIFSLPSCSELEFHFAVDSDTKRYKFYISLYKTELKQALSLISEIKNILGITQRYYLDASFERFDSLGFDIKDGGIDMKIYELLFHLPQTFKIPAFTHQLHIKEKGVLKDFSGRKKYFIRFHDGIDIQYFGEDFDITQSQVLSQALANDYHLQKKVKYFCEENGKKEIYFI